MCFGLDRLCTVPDKLLPGQQSWDSHSCPSQPLPHAPLRGPAHSEEVTGGSPPGLSLLISDACAPLQAVVRVIEEYCRRWRKNPSGNCSQKWPTRVTASSTSRRHVWHWRWLFGNIYQSLNEYSPRSQVETSLGITVEAVNDAPVLSGAPSALGVDEDSALLVQVGGPARLENLQDPITCGVPHNLMVCLIT